MKLRVQKEDLDEAVAQNLLLADQKQALWDFLQTRNKGSLQALTVLAYFGALIVISSMTWFATKAFSESNPWILLATGVSYFLFFLVAGLSLKTRMTNSVPAMLSLTIAVFMVPLSIYALQRVTGMVSLDFPGSYHDYYAWINGGWFFMELGTVAVSLVFLWLWRFEFLTFPLAFTLWFLSMDLAPILFGKSFDWDDRRILSLYFGLAMLVVSYIFDLLKKDRDYAFWLYLFGLVTFWCGISFSSTDQLVLKFLYCGMNILLVLIALLFRRTVFLVFGAMGIFLFLFDLSDNVFRDSLLFPLFLSLVGAGILAVSVWLFRLQGRMDAFLARKIPESLKKFIPRMR